MHLGVTGQLQMTEKMRAGLSLINRTGTQCSKTTPQQPAVKFKHTIPTRAKPPGEYLRFSTKHLMQVFLPDSITL